MAVVPLAARYATVRMKAARSADARLLGYRLLLVSLLLAVLLSLLLVPPASLIESQLRNRGATWLPSRELISALALGLVLVTALPVLMARKVAAFRINFLRQAKKLRDLLPQTREERAWFTAAVVCTAICEEVLYRGFLLHYLHVFPWRLNIATAIVIACGAYGLAHLYRGADNVLQTVLLALGQCLLFLCTRSLALPILLHVAIDLRVVMLLPSVQLALAESKQRETVVQR